MKVYLKCDKKYNGKNSQTIDASWIRSDVLEKIVLLYANKNKNNNLAIYVTEEVVDCYNKLVGGNSCKSAQSIVKNLRVKWLQEFADELVENIHYNEY